LAALPADQYLGADGAAQAGSLTVVGTGIRLIGHLTQEARAELEAADELLFVSGDAATSAWLRRVNPNTRSLGSLYHPGRSRHETYDEMVDEILAAVRRGGRVCVALYGHPGVFVSPSHEAIARAREEGYSARMLPGVSAEDCLFADLGVNPGLHGCQNYEATELLVRGHVVDPTAALILWQLDVLGKVEYAPDEDTAPLHVLAEYLLRFYAPEHEALFYMASPYAIRPSLTEATTVEGLAELTSAPLPTLYVPPLEPRPADPEMLRRLGMAVTKG
jgi:hypothetical protein